MHGRALSTKEKFKVGVTIIFSIVVFVLSLFVVPAEYFVISTFPVLVALRSIERTYLKIGNRSK